MKLTKGMITVMSVASGVAVLAGGVDAAWAQCTAHELAKLLASDGAPDDWLGAVAICGDTAVVGAWRHDENGEDSGAAYVFRRNVSIWVQEAKLTPADGTRGDAFGFSVACLDDSVVIGATGDDDNGEGSGAAYVFRRYEDSYPCPTGTECNDCGRADPPTCTASVCEGACWIEEAKLLPSDGAAWDAFGRAGAVSGEIVVITALHAQGIVDHSGAGYVFEKPPTGWTNMTETAKLVQSDGAGGDDFGTAAGIDADTVVVSAQYDGENGIESGSAYVFVRPDEGWDSIADAMTETAKLLPSDGAAGDLFGNYTGVAISGDTALIGAYLDDDNGSDSGSAYVFVEPDEGWDSVVSPITEDQKLLPFDGAEGDGFGCSVSVSGGAAIVGARDHDGNANDSGSAYLFRFDGLSWAGETKFLASDSAQDDFLGCTVAISGSMAVIGAYGDDDNGSDSGSAYVFDLSDTNGDGVIDACDCNMNSIPDENEPTTSRVFCVRCDSPSPPNDCSDGSQWSFMLDWIGAGPDFEELNCGPVTPTSGTTAVDMAEEFVECIDATVCQGITTVQFGSGRCFRVTVPGTVHPDICVGLAGGPSNGCCPNPPCVFNPTLLEVYLSENDCNNNGEDDAIDIALGTSPDANSDGIPDECGACCGAGPCVQVTQPECESRGWLYRGDATTCEQEQCDDIPTVSEWGLVVMTLLVLACGSIVIARRRVGIA